MKLNVVQSPFPVIDVPNQGTGEGLRVRRGEPVPPPPVHIRLDLRPPLEREMGLAVYRGTLYYHLPAGTVPTILDLELWQAITSEEFGR